MKAIAYSAPRQFDFIDVKTLSPARGQVLIHVRGCGLCGTDLHIHKGEFMVKFPLIPGHELQARLSRLGQMYATSTQVIVSWWTT